ncbi:glycine cleavage system protein GcvH [Suttonella sp. R2A3]|uniref:glycine cleavage system protein GcvH n=1 Tax=Suttonella sp. R2A3 TaxID=2908648 RepID=UPI001F404AFE|nr:glycine cleavage system protein GcvH [Suttonella sp. R2A3]UJF24915.1 glycine cleavage system protein GcvH [Suttonella sp. R2A3]
MKKFSKDHEWVEIVDGVGTVGITDHAQSELGDIVFVELPEVGAEIAAGDEVAVIESVKAAGEVNSPVSGEVIEVNEVLIDEPGTVNSSAEDDGWVYKIKLSNESELDDLMDEDGYQAFIA